MGKYLLFPDLSRLSCWLSAPHKGIPEQSSCGCLSFSAKCAVSPYWTKLPLHEVAVLGLYLHTVLSDLCLSSKQVLRFPLSVCLGA